MQQSPKVPYDDACHPLGVNVVKTNDGPDACDCDEDAILDDYQRTVSLTHQHTDYLMLNLSCPNAKDGRKHFSQPGSIARLLDHLKQSLGDLAISCPVFLKVAPRDESAEHERLLAECDGFDFVRGFSFNLPSGKPKDLRLRTADRDLCDKPGAIAGKPVEERINHCISGLYRIMDQRRYSIIASGGVSNAEDAYRKICLGASLVQIYTAMIYGGPSVVASINRGLVDCLRRDGFANVQSAIGAASIP